MSAIWSGPKNGSRKPKQLRTTSSTSCGEASPSSTHLRASRNRAFWMRFATNPGPSPTSAGRFPMFFRNLIIRSTTSGSVALAGITSTPGVHSGGLNQCVPRNRSGCSTALASSSIGNDEVLDTMTASGGAAFEQAARISCLRSSFSGAAPKTSPASLDASGAPSAVSPAAARPAASSESNPASACPPMRSTSLSFASRVISGVASVSRTPRPAAAKHSATPRPMVPPPITATVRGQPSYELRSSILSLRQGIRSQASGLCVVVLTLLKPPSPVLHGLADDVRQILLCDLARRPDEQALLLYGAVYQGVYVVLGVAEDRKS